MNELWRIGKKIQEMREYIGFTQLELAGTLSISDRYLRILEQKGTRDICWLFKIADALEIHLLQLIPEDWYSTFNQKEQFLLLFDNAYMLSEADRNRLLQIAEELVKRNKLP